ncbi:MAG: hypothetical protein L3K02_04620 [Thermoplasmata archaeon]|nr:hypothetical protein [Thermoplasmata archaeon]
MSGPNYATNPPPPPGQPATWMPPGPPMSPPAPAVPMSQRFTPEHMAARVPWSFLAFVAQSLGLLFLFVGGLVAVSGGVLPPGCVSTPGNCNMGTAANVDWAIMVARLLLVLGLFGLAAGAGLHLQFRPGLASGASAEETRAYIARRRGEFILLLVSILLLFWIVSWSVTVLT